MTNLKSSARKPIVFLLASFVLCTCLGRTASAQKMLSGSAWRSVVMDNGKIPAHTKIRIRTAQPIAATTNDCLIFHGVVARDVFGSDGQVLINEGSDAELVVKPISGDRMALDIRSVTINGQVFAPETAQAGVESPRVAAQIIPYYQAQGLATAQTIDIPENCLLTFRLVEPLVVVG